MFQASKSKKKIGGGGRRELMLIVLFDAQIRFDQVSFIGAHLRRSSGNFWFCWTGDCIGGWVELRGRKARVQE